jgi:hypothetical protein
MLNNVSPSLHTLLSQGTHPHASSVVKHGQLDIAIATHPHREQ